MILSDNETKFDLLNNEAIAKTVVNLIKESNNQPISIGIHGDWGAGKSSILEMIEDLFNHTDKDDGKKYCCIRFNGWKHQGFEDSKIALMSAIVSELTAKENLQETAKEILGKLWKNINWMTVAKTAGKTALGIATGTAPIAVLSSVRDMLKSTVTTQEGIANAIDVIGGYLKESKITEDTSSNTEFTEFHKNFKELLEKANIKKLVVLIDDLDRCLPDVAINTLEAVRLFMFTGETAFVVAADESMIRYAVKKHFPDVVDENKYNVGIEFSNKYLEKLIQVPFRIPALGEVEACNYIMLLMVGSVLSEENTNYKALRSEGISRIKKPWDVRYFTVSDVQKILKDDYAKASNETLIATQIGHLLSHNTDGNPRKIKRFINMLLLRFEIAKNRGFGAEIDLAILAKMMLAEYYFPNFYEQLPAHLTSDGVWKDAKTVKDSIENEPDETVTKKADVSSHNENWFDPKEIKDWILLEPDIMDVDLRPYYYACKEKIDYFAGRAESSDLSEIVDILLKSEMVVTQYIDKLKGLTEQQSEQVFGIIAQRIMEKGNFENKPDGIDGLRILVQQKNSLRRQLADFIAGLPKTQVGVWVTNGWNKAIPSDCSEHSIIDKYFEELKTDGNPIVQGTLKAVRRKDVIGHIIS
ncbi:Qat anti-phage system ATPase QatA [Dysosmobacter welbionis]